MPCFQNIRDRLTYLYRPENIFTHAWRPGDLVLWDNLALQHGRNDFSPEWKRHIRRVQIGPA